MKAPFPDLKKTFSDMWYKTDGIRLSDVRLSRLVYYLAYALELTLFAARGQFLPIGANLFGLSGWMVAHTAHMISSLVFMLLWTVRFKRLLYIAVGLMLAGFLPFVFLPVGVPRLLCAILFYIGLGGAVTGCRCGYAFAANNAERFAGIIVMFLSVALLRFARSLGAESLFFTHVLPLALLAALCLCLLHFREEDFEVKDDATGKDAGGLYWAFAFFALYFSFDGYNAALTTGKNNPDFLYFFIGMLLAAGILFLAVAKLRLNVWHVWNIFFIASFCMGLLATFAPQLGTEKPQYFFGGLSMIGWPLCIYVLGCAQRSFASYRLLKRCTLVYVVLSPIITLSSDLTESFVPDALPVVSMLFILFFGIAFLMVSPFSYQSLFSAVWLPDIYRADMVQLRETVEKTDRFDGYQLTPRQKEIAVLLLAAKTGRQIAGELGLSESTVKMHTSELYKRLGVSSRTEMFRVFGVTDDTQAKIPSNIPTCPKV